MKEGLEAALFVFDESINSGDMEDTAILRAVSYYRYKHPDISLNKAEKKLRKKLRKTTSHENPPRHRG